MLCVVGFRRLAANQDALAASRAPPELVVATFLPVRSTISTSLKLG